MNHINQQTLNIRTLLLPIIGETKAKTYFSYYGIFKDDLMFGLYKEGLFYLKLAEKDVSEAISLGMKCLIDPKISKTNMFYLIPDPILHNLSTYTTWFTASLAEIQSNKVSLYKQRKRQIRSLPNLNLNLERTLKKVNINSVEDLIEKGEVKVFIELIKIGIDVDHSLLFKLYGAINHQFIYTLSEKTKRDLLTETDEALYEAGLRKRFNSK
ncbi:TfoX/Sxy family DNA transformation protein [Ursidibacter arcticus]|uniref:TfoX/Sxy family DNA transformation protein n=1 Tax=Ursidibacter arcticus TaxID=1524965 RepID=UPI0012FC272D|nr:TfoX/Sxy family DNA transformation protein [Ursidibacter arcticus]KAE9535511.1 DNA transformation protein [Ursidibacter arcticus]